MGAHLADGRTRLEIPLTLALSLALLVAAGVAFYVTGDNPPHPNDWLTDGDVEALADVLSTYDGWTAGCLLEGRDDAPIEVPGAELLNVTVNGRKAVMFHLSGVPVTGNYGEVWRDGAFCYVPEPRPGMVV